MKNFKHLSFYLFAISFVIILFTLVTSYGENNLKAATKIDGTYKIETNFKSEFNCPSIPLQLIVQQSGIYLNAALIPIELKSEAKPKVQISELSGKFQQNQLSLSGKSQICKSDLLIEAQISNKNLIGKIVSKGITTNFTATQIEPSELKTKSY
jgi:hypothetical protein